MKAIKWGIIGLLVFTIVFNFMPTGNTATDVVTGFQALRSYGTAQTSMAQDLIEAATGDQDEYTKMTNAYAGELRGKIVQFAIETALSYGNGYQLPGESGKYNSHHLQQGTKISYSTGGKWPCLYPGCSSVNDVWGGTHGYAGFDCAYNNYQLIVSGKLDHMHFSCHGSCFFTWKMFWVDSPFLTGINSSKNNQQWVCNTQAGFGQEADASDCISIQLTSTASTSTHDKDAILEEIRKVAEPGDIIWNTDETSHYAHSQMWLGDISFTDAEGNVVEIKDAYMNCGGRQNGNDWAIKPFSPDTRGSFHYYVLKLSDTIGYVYKNPDAEPVTREESELVLPEVEDGVEVHVNGGA